MPARLVLWRHGQTDWNLAGRFQGRRDIALNAAGVAQAQAAAPRVAALYPTRIVSSPLARARATAEALAELVGLEVVCDDRLMEIDVAEWEGLTIADVRAAHPDFAAAAAAGLDVRRGVSGETDGEVGARVGQALREIAAAGSDELVCVVTHGLAMQAGAANLLGWDFVASRQLALVRNCAWSELEPLADRRWRIRSWNVTADDAVDPIVGARI